VALGQTFVILTGGIDLSIPWTLNSAAVMLTLFTKGHDENLIWAVPLILVMALVIGLINGIGVTLLGISPVIMTLGMNAILQGALVGYTSGGRPGSVAPPAISFLAQGNVAGIPVDLILWLAIIVVATLLLSFTTLGRSVYAIGNNALAARFSGISVTRVRIFVYCFSALSSALAGIILTGRVGRSYLGMGDLYLFASVAAVAIGGGSILGGSGHYLGTVAGTFILTLIAGLLPIFNMPASAQQILYGLIVLGMVLLARGRAAER
jgi:ribose transport system permease protein